jgi:VWFA-related protein
MLAALCQPAAPAAQPPPSLVIVEPLPGRALRGPCTLRARLAPERLPVLRLTFTADGRLVCAREAPPWECAWDAGEGFASHSIRAVAMLADGSRLVDSVRTEAAAVSPPAAADVAEVAADVVEVAVDVVQVAAAVTDGEGRRVRGLGPADFRVFEDDRPQQVSHFIGDEAERELVVAVDMSGSMSEAMPVCRAAVKRFLSTLRPADRVTLLAFNDSVFTVARRDAAPETRLRALDRLRAWGSTAFHDAVLRGLDLVENHRGRRALVVFSDGEDMVSHATVEDVLARIEVSATPLYLIAQGEGMRQQRLKRVIDRIAGVSGGRSFYTKRIEQLGGVFAEIGEDLASQYLLAYVPESAVAQDAVWRTIRVEVAKRPNAYTVRARQGYRALARGRWP